VTGTTGRLIKKIKMDVVLALAGLEIEYQEQTSGEYSTMDSVHSRLNLEHIF
jgi:hypothetical protein